MENVVERSTHVQLLDGSVVKMTEGAREALLAKLNNLSGRALRCLGLAYKDQLGELSDYDGENHPAHSSLLNPSNYDKIETDLIFVGMAGLRVISLPSPHVLSRSWPRCPWKSSWVFWGLQKNVE